MNIQHLLKQAQSMQSDMEKIERDISEKEMIVDAHGIKLTMKGSYKLVAVSIKPELLTLENKEIIEDILILNINKLTQQIQNERAETLGEIAQRLKIPGVI
jgi:DNA-binding protein YbaB